MPNDLESKVNFNVIDNSFQSKDLMILERNKHQEHVFVRTAILPRLDSALRKYERNCLDTKLPATIVKVLYALVGYL